MGRTARAAGGRSRSVGLAVAAVGVIAVAAGVLWPSLQGRGTAAASGGGVIRIPSADADAAASYWGARLSSAPPGSGGPQASGSAGAGALASPGLPSPAGSGTGSLHALAGPGAPMAVSNPLSGAPFGGVSQVGALFGTENGSISGQGHYCSGSVVNSPKGDIVVTAAHCVYDSSGVYTDIAFVPGYHDGQDPYGVWIPSAVVVAPQWASSSSPDYDVAFLVVHEAGSTARIQDVVGGDQLQIQPPYNGLTQVIGYPQATDKPIGCTNYTAEYSDPSLATPELQFPCAGFPGGTSGGPFLQNVDANTGQGTIVGVVGGYQAGGDTPDESYSSYFGDWVGSLLAQAESES
jgi:V8-like Glu-specific endopeptidase